MDNAIDYKINQLIKYKLYTIGEMVTRIATYVCITIAILATLSLFGAIFDGVVNIVHDNQPKPTGMFYCEPNASGCMNPSCGRGIDYFEINTVRTYIARVNNHIKYTSRTTGVMWMSSAVAYFMWILRRMCKSESKNYKPDRD
ncbi:hypothetical protein F-liban_351 [Faustovirus]|nr:hypothetical protein F-liban_351 [Faustovirus]